MPANSPKRLPRRDVLAAGAAGAAGLLLPQWARAADVFPSRPITFICPWPAGGTADTLDARHLPGGRGLLRPADRRSTTAPAPPA